MSEAAELTVILLQCKVGAVCQRELYSYNFMRSSPICYCTDTLRIILSWRSYAELHWAAHVGDCRSAGKAGQVPEALRKGSRPGKLLDGVREAIRRGHMPDRTPRRATHIGSSAIVRFHGMPGHPNAMGAAEAEAFLRHPAAGYGPTCPPYARSRGNARKRGQAAGPAVRFPLDPSLPRQGKRGAAPFSHEREHLAKSRCESNAQGEDQQTRKPSHLPPQLRDALTGKRLRH